MEVGDVSNEVSPLDFAFLPKVTKRRTIDCSTNRRANTRGLLMTMTVSIGETEVGTACRDPTQIVKLRSLMTRSGAFI